MDNMINVRSAIDGFSLPALAAPAQGRARGGVVVVQEIFGITPHIAAMADVFAREGYDVLAPAMFDRVEAGFLAAPDPEGFTKGIKAVTATPWAQVAADIQACIDALPKPCFVTGFCWGGAAAWLAAARCTDVRAVSCFYGRLITGLLDETLHAPAMLHYGARDESIPLADVERVRAAAPPDTPLYIYDAGHGFCRQGGHGYDQAAAELALGRTCDWFARWA